MRFLLLAFLLVSLIVAEEEDEGLDGRIQEFDEIILEPETLKAIAFSTEDETNTYKEILWDALILLDIKSQSMNTEAAAMQADYYKYILHNVIKYTNKWLSEEVVRLIDKTNDKNEKHRVDWTWKRNIAEFIYYKSGDYGVELILNNEDRSFEKRMKSTPHDEF